MNRDARITPGRRLGKKRGIWLNVISLDLAKVFEEFGCPGQPANRIVGLIAAEAHDGLAKFIPHVLLVLLVGKAEESLCRSGIEIILERLRGVFDAVGIRIGARWRRAELMVDDQHGPAAWRRLPVEDAVVYRHWNRHAVLIHGRCAHGAVGQWLVQGLTSRSRYGLRHFKCLHPQLRCYRRKFSPGKAAWIS